ncbi:MAG: Na+/H+ antiporter subunit E [Gammaproteobacteria bacterium]
MTVTRRWLPHPRLSILLLVVWLLLVNSLAPGHILLGAVLGLVISRVTRAFWLQRPRISRPLLLLVFAGRVLWDIVIANLHVARIVLGSQAAISPRFTRLPLDLTDQFAITVLANTISLTPGTVTADVAADRKSLLIHSLHVVDEAALVAGIKRRYEKPLKEIFEC